MLFAGWQCSTAPSSHAPPPCFRHCPPLTPPLSLAVRALSTNLEGHSSANELPALPFLGEQRAPGRVQGVLICHRRQAVGCWACRQMQQDVGLDALRFRACTGGLPPSATDLLPCASCCAGAAPVQNGTAAFADLRTTSVPEAEGEEGEEQLPGEEAPGRLSTPGVDHS